MNTSEAAGRQVPDEYNHEQDLRALSDKVVQALTRTDGLIPRPELPADLDTMSAEDLLDFCADHAIDYPEIPDLDPAHASPEDEAAREAFKTEVRRIIRDDVAGDEWPREGFDAAETIESVVQSVSEAHTPPLDTFTRAYVDAIIFTESGPDNLRDKTLSDFSPSAVTKIQQDCAKFQSENAELIGSRYEDAGHDFWLTRNNHGAGFWDGGWPDDVDGKLSQAAEAFGTSEVYVGDDDLVYVHGAEKVTEATKTVTKQGRKVDTFVARKGKQAYDSGRKRLRQQAVSEIAAECGLEPAQVLGTKSLADKVAIRLKKLSRRTPIKEDDAIVDEVDELVPDADDAGDTKQEAYDDMKRELESGECAIIRSKSSGPDEVWLNGKLLGRIDPDYAPAPANGRFRPFERKPQGVFTSREDALRGIKAAMTQQGFFPNVYSVNERGNVTLLDFSGNELDSWV